MFEVFFAEHYPASGFYPANAPSWAAVGRFALRADAAALASLILLGGSTGMVRIGKVDPVSQEPPPAPLKPIPAES